MTTVTYLIPAISCGHCVHTIKTELSELQGVQAVDGDPTTKIITVTFDPPASEMELKKLLTELDYPVAE